LRIVDFIEFDDEITIKVKEDGNAIDKFLKYFECALSLHYCGFAKCLLKVADNLVIALFRLHHVFA